MESKCKSFGLSKLIAGKLSLKTNTVPVLFLLGICMMSYTVSTHEIALSVRKTFNIDSLGACQGVSVLNGKVFLYGDREVGMIREYTHEQDSLRYTGNEYKLTLEGKDLINHPTGIACHEKLPTFIGNSIRLNPEGTRWKAVIYCVDWKGLQKTHTLDGNLLNTIEDDACIQGTRPEYVKYQNKWFVATADYGNKSNEVRIYDPSALKKASKTSENGVLVKKFSCGPWVQNLHWIADKNILVLIQNQIEGRRWRFTFLDFSKSMETGHEVILKTIDFDKTDELEGFALIGKSNKGIAVTSSRKANVHFTESGW
ncbi:hypothetical protein SAMN04515674_101210 [Pseudarcicella hirudinis]|uniref:Glutamine cyclotransferase n=2 Tax=Pseudarcicella hirudinis TaxID=1079859 RepID=A0A1I5MA63_9BACT|nr:hypothetical protein [Pseudarcicella hirudinis]SFP06508.1 hypothetical protein SAMN04515674_101210 [Pseudarcicella hirudinis]